MSDRESRLPSLIERGPTGPSVNERQEGRRGSSSAKREAANNGGTLPVRESIARLYAAESILLREYVTEMFPSLADDAEDIVHIVFEKVCEGKCRYWDKELPQGYLRGTAVNVVREYFRSRRRQTEAAHHAVGARESGVRDPLDAVIADETAAEVQHAVARLPHKSREAVEEAYFQSGESVVQTSGQDRSQRDVVRKRLEYALRKLRAHLVTQQQRVQTRGKRKK